MKITGKQELMKKPNYVLKFNESVYIPKNETTFYIVMKWILIVILIVMGIGQIISGGELFEEFSIATWICLISYIIAIVKMGGWKENPSPCELQFYDEYLIFCRPKTYYTKNRINTQFYKLKYSDISTCRHRTVAKQIKIKGKSEFTMYKHYRNGEIDHQKPPVHKKEGGGFWFVTIFSPEIDFVKEIEEHSPLKVEIDLS